MALDLICSDSRSVGAYRLTAVFLFHVILIRTAKTLNYSICCFSANQYWQHYRFGHVMHLRRLLAPIFWSRMCCSWMCGSQCYQRKRLLVTSKTARCSGAERMFRTAVPFACSVRLPLQDQLAGSAFSVWS